MPGLNRYLRVTPSGLLRIDQAAIAGEERLDGKWLPRCSDPTLSAEDIALGYKQLLEVERGWRDMKTHLKLRPRGPPQRRTHPLPRTAVLARATTDQGRRDQRPDPHLAADPRATGQTLHLGQFTGNAGTSHQRTELTTDQRDILTRQQLPEPARFLRLDPATS